MDDNYICNVCNKKKENELNYIPRKDGSILIICDDCVYETLQGKGFNSNKIKELLKGVIL